MNGHKFITMSHSGKIIISWSFPIPFDGLILHVEFRSPFSYCYREFDMETDISTYTTICG